MALKTSDLMQNSVRLLKAEFNKAHKFPGYG